LLPDLPFPNPAAVIWVVVMTDDLPGFPSELPPFDRNPVIDSFNPNSAPQSNFNQSDGFGAFNRGQPVFSAGNPVCARGAWTQYEDELLTYAVQQLGSKRWIDVAKFVPSRNSKQCRERWFHRLSPEIRHEPFEPWEDALIIENQQNLGNRWSLIAQKIPGRSACSVKNRWYSGLKSQDAARYVGPRFAVHEARDDL
jgi:hypothetical protein